MDFVNDSKFHGLRERVRLNLDHLGRPLKVGSMFSGWGVLEMVLRELVHEWQPRAKVGYKKSFLLLRIPLDN